MLVRKRMKTDLVSIHPTASVEDAFHVMREKEIRHLPVLDVEGELVGFVTEGDLLLVSPSPAASLRVQDMLAELSRLKISEVMNRDPVTVDADATLEEAAALMIDHKINALPVLSNGKLVGIITETDIFRMFLEVLDAQVPAMRLSLLIPDEKGIIAMLCGEIASAGGSILSLGMFQGSTPGTRTLALKVAEVSEPQLRRIAEKACDERGCRVLDLRADQPRGE